MYRVRIEVVNQHGLLSKNLVLFVIERKLRDLKVYIEGDSPYIVEPHQAIRFFVVMEITNRYGASLQVEFGDGDIHSADLEDTNSTSMALNCQQGQMMVVASYGLGCLLKVDFLHSYSDQGTFQPIITIEQRNQTLISRLNDVIMVIHRLQRAVIQSDRTIAINRPANFTLQFTHRPINITVLWIISNNHNYEIADFMTFDLDLSYTFTEPGIYFVKSIASNVISNDTAVTSLFVQIPISNLRISCGENIILQTGEEIQCVAEIENGSDPKFVWTFYKGHHFYPLSVSKNASSVIQYTFNLPGTYNISVKAYNNVSRSLAYIDHVITVLDPVNCVSIRSWGPTKVSEKAVFEIITCQGSDIQLHFDFGLGRRSYGRPYQKENAYYIGNVFQRHGIYNVTVYAFNAVSEMSDTTQVLVQRDIELLEIDIYGESIVGKPTVFYVKNEGQIVIRDDVTFLWEFSDITRIFSSLPIIAKTFTAAGSYNVDLSAANLVAAFENASLKFDIRERRQNEWIVIHDIVVAVNQSVEFVLQGDNPNWTSIQIRYGRNDIQIIEGGVNRWSHMFTKAKMYQLEVTIVTGGKNYVIDSLVVVQEPITGLVLRGPQVIELERLNRQTISMEGIWMSLIRDYLWEADTKTGTNIVYTWYLGFGGHIKTTLNKYMKGFESPGVHTVEILAQNEISKMSASLTVFVQYPIIDVTASVKKVALGMMTPINITVDGGKQFFVYIDFGDGTTFNVSSDEESYTSKTESLGHSIQVPEYLVILSHKYPDVGIYNISINVSNYVSYDVTSKMAVVGEPITGVQLHTENGSVVHVTRKVVVMATVTTGKDLRFEWDFGDRVPPIVDSYGNTSVATHIYDVPAEYEVKVKVSNPFYEVPVVKTLPYNFLVVDEIEHVSIEEINGRTAAPLEQGFSPFMKTPEVTFKARCVEGSHVSFLFDFGDGDTMMVSGIENPFLNLGFSGIASHHYTEEGIYEVKVTAINPLGNVTVYLPTPFYVQIPPRGLEMDQRSYYTKYGDKTYICVNITQGTNVTFDWKLGDQSDLISDGGYCHRHQYMKAGIFEIVVIAKNKVTRDEIKSFVSVQHEIQGVFINVESLRVDTNTPVQFMAVTFPESAYVSYFKWNFGTQKDSEKLSIGAEYSYRYGRSGKYIATVTAINDVSKAESEPIELHVLTRVRKLDIEIFKKVPLVNQPFNFSYSLYSGSDVLFTWSFGDGTPDLVINGSHEYVNHTYKRIAEYKLTLTASNVINNLTVSKNIFVLDRICHPPIVRILGRHDKRHKIFKSDGLYVEADLEPLQCGNYTAVEFLWVIYNQTTQEEISLENKHDIIWNKKILILPSSLLQVGKYIIKVKVKIKDLIVYSKDKHSLQVLSSPLISHIKGGQLRNVLREDLVILNGSKSMDPDDPGTKLRFNWTCVIKNKEEPCFNESLSSLIKWNESVLSVPGTWFPRFNDSQNFLVNLTVTAPGKQGVSTYQIIDVKDKTLPIMIICPQCEAPTVNSNERITFQMAYRDYGTMGHVEFEWEVELVEGPVPSNIYAHDNPCVSPDGSSYLAYRFSSNETAENETTTTKAQDIKTISSATSSLPTQISTESTSVSPHENPWDSPVEGKGNNGRQTRGNNKLNSSPSHSTNSIAGHIPGVSVVSENTNVKSSRHLHQEPIEGFPGEVGSTAGDRRISILEETDLKNGIDPDPVQDTTLKIRQKDVLILDRKRILQNFKPLTSTGVNQQSLVINPGSLRQGRTYAVSAIVKTKDGRLKGHAITTFKVNKSPSLGACEINPSSGEEIKTVFRVYCREWMDKDLPLQYEVSYNLNINDTKYVIYRGQKQDIHFTLPAGNPQNNNKVFVYITILDNYEARTTVCSIDIQVLPRDVDRYSDKGTGTDVELHQSMEALIYVEAFDKHGQLAAARDRGDDHTVKVLTRYFSSRLNNLPQVIGHEDQAWRQRLQIRKILLGILSELPIRNKMEAIESLQALIFVTKSLQIPQQLITRREVWLELSQALDLAVDILRSSFTIYSESLTLNEVLSTLLVQASSNIIKAIAESGQVDSSHKWFYQHCLSRSLDVLEHVIKKDLAFHLLGEPPIKKGAEFVSTLATIYQYQKQETPIMMIDQSKFVLPSNMDYVVSASSKVNWTDEEKFVLCRGCFTVHMTRFKQNPFSFKNRNNQKVQSEVIALKIYNYDGSPVPVNGLPDNNLVTMEIPRLVEENSTEMSHTLLKSAMNVHQFNISKDNLLHSLHIRVQLEHIESDGRLFPVAVLLRYKNPPTPDKHLFLGEINTDSTDLKVFLPAGYFNVTGEYNIGIVDAGYNFGRPREGEITSRNYTLKLWWTRCLSWDRKENDWTDFGCWSTELSTYYVTQCRCNHLTEFGTHFELIPNELTIIPIDDFFALNKNPVTLTLIGLVLCMYACFLVICHKADIHDSKKGGIMYLQDNVITDKQKYEITMETGFRKGAGTTAKISIILHGEEGMSETRELISNDHRPLFERNSRDSFIMTLPDSIGKIWKVQVWHNNFGQSPSWYLSRVIVKDLNTEKTYYFICEKWLAVEEDDGKVEREFMTLEGNLGFRKVFWAKGTQYLSDYHLWISLFTRPCYSQFTRVQRLTCCLTSTMMYMCLNAVWFNYKADKEYRGEFGLLDLSVRNVVIGAACCACVIPINQFLALLFRRSKHVLDKEGEIPEEEKEKEYPSGKPDEQGREEDEDDEETVQPVMTYSILDQSIMNWPSIQDWAQKQWVKRQQSALSIGDTTSNKTDRNHTSNSPTVTQILQKRLVSSETDQASSGFEDSNSTDPRRQFTISSQASSVKNKAPSVSSSGSQKFTATVIKEKPRRRIFLPFWCQYVAWFLCTVITIGCAIMTVWYGFRFGSTTGSMWLQSLYFSFLICVFISHPLLILIAVVYTAIKYRNDPSIIDHYEDGYFGEKAKLEIRRQKKEKSKETCDENEELERGVAARQRSRYLRFARPPQEKQLIEARKKIMKEKKAMSLMRNSLGFGIMLVLLIVMAYGKDVTSPFYLNEALRNELLRTGMPKFVNIRTPVDWYNWSMNSMLDVLYPDCQTGEHFTARKEKYILHGSILLIGDIHLRQLKVNEEQCTPEHLIGLRQLPVTCYYSYSSSNKMTDSFGKNQTFNFQRESSFYRIFGKHGVYDNSGYVIKLNTTRSEALLQLQSLKQDVWIDRKSRAIIIEFTTYSAPTNLFSSVVLLLELPPTGGALPNHRIMSTYVYRYVTRWDNIILACELIFIILTVYKLKNELCDMIKLRESYFHNAWNIVEVILGTLSICYIACYVYRFVLVSDTVESLRRTYHEEFVDISLLTVWDEILRAQIGFILFLTVVKSLRLLRYHKLFALFGNVYRRVHREILILSALFMVLLLGFSGLGYALFGTLCWSFKDFGSGLLTMTALMTRNYSYMEIEPSLPYMARLFVFCFCVFVTGLLTCYVVAILSFRFKIFKHKQTDILAMPAREAILFYYEEFLVWTGIKPVEPLEEPENVLPPEFTMAEIEYQVDELFFRINALSGSHSLPEKPTEYLTDSDGVYGVFDDGISSGGSEVHLADEERLEHRVQKIEDNLCSQEPYLAQLLQLDSIGANLLSQEREKQLRSHLELEIFRQLQMQRQDVLPGQQPSAEASSKGNTSKIKPSTSWPNKDPSQPHNRKTKEDIKLTSGHRGVENFPEDSQERNQRQNIPLRQESSPSSILTVSDVQPETSSSSNPESPSEQQINPSRVKKTLEKPGKSTFHRLFDHSDKSGSQSSDSDRGLGSKTAKLNKPEQWKRPDPPPKPTFIHPNVRELPAVETNRPNLLESPALRQLRTSLNAIERTSSKGDNSGSSFTTESSSGSEDAFHCMQRPIGKRNLRKTKSRGKGKGSGNLTSSFLLDELDIESKEEEDDQFDSANHRGAYKIDDPEPILEQD